MLTPMHNQGNRTELWYKQNGLCYVYGVMETMHLASF